MFGPVECASSNLPSNSSASSSGGSSCVGAVYQTAHKKAHPQADQTPTDELLYLGFWFLRSGAVNCFSLVDHQLTA